MDQNQHPVDLTVQHPVVLSQETERSLSTPLAYKDKEETGRLAVLAFGPEVQQPNTEDEKKDVNELAKSVYDEERQADTFEAIQKGAKEGTLSARDSLNLYAGRYGVGYDNPSIGNQGLATLLARRAIDAYLEERNQLTTEQKELIASVAEYDESVLTKRIILDQLHKQYGQGKNSSFEWVSLIPGYAQVQAHGRDVLGSSSFTSVGIDEDNYNIVQEAILDNNITPEQFAIKLDKTIKSLPEDKRAEFVNRLVDNHRAENSWGLLFDIFSAVGGATKIAGGASKGAQVAAKAGKSIVTGAIKGAVKATPREIVDQVLPFGGETVDIVGKIVKPRTAVKDLSSKASVLKSAGASNAAAESVSRDIAKLHTDELVENSLPVVMRQSLDSISMPTVEAMPSLAHKASMLNEKGYQELLRLTALSIKAHTGKIARLSKEAQDVYIDGLRREVQASVAPSHAHRFNDMLMWDRSTEASDNIVLKTRMGTGLTGSEGFLKRKDAVTLARDITKNTKGIDDSVMSARVVKLGKEYFVDTTIRLNRNEGMLGADYIQGSASGRIREQQAAAPKLIQGVFTLPFKSHYTRILNGLKAQSDESVNSIISKVVDKHTKLNKKEKIALEDLVATSRERRTFFEPEALKESGYSDAVINAYGARRLLNDLDYMIENANTRERMSKAGYRTYNGVIGKTSRLRGLEEDDSFVFQYLSSDGITGEQGVLTGKEAKELIKRGAIAIKPLETSEIDYYITKEAQLITDRLPFTVINYVPGGRAYYSDDLTFIKQMRTDIGGKKILGSRTFKADMDPSKATRWAEDMEDLRTRYISGNLTDEYVQGKNPALLPFSSVRELKEFFEDSGISLAPEARIEAVKNGQPLASYESAVSEGKLVELEEGHLRDVSYLSGYHLQSHVLKLQAKHRYDTMLYDLQGEAAPRMSFKEEMKRLQSDIVSAGETDLFTKMYADDFYRTYKDVLYNGEHLHPVDALLYGKFKPASGAFRDKVVSGENAQLNYKAILHAQSDFDKAIDDIISKSFTAITKESFESSKNVSNLYEGIKKLKPLSKMRQFSYHFFMGVFSAPQFIRQFSQVINSAALASPSALPKAMKYFMPALGALASGADPASVKVAARNIATLDPAFNVGDTEAVLEALHQMPWAQGLQGGMNIDNVGMTKLGRLSAGFALSGEAGSRVFNNLLALSEAGIGQSKRWGDLSALEKAEILNRANNLYLNMNATGLSRVQASSVGATLVQMLTFNLRFVDMLLDPEISRAAKARLAVTLLATTGLNGVMSPVGLGGLGYALYGQTVDEPTETSDLVYKYFMDGVANTVLSEITGREYDWFKGNSVQLLDNLSTFEDIRDVKVPVYTTISKTFNAVSDVVRASALYADDEIDREEFMNIVESTLIAGNAPSGLTRAIRADLIYKEGVLLNSKGHLLKKDMDKLDALMYLLGFDKKTQVQDFVVKSMLQEGYEPRRDIIKELRPLVLQASRRGDFKSISNFFKLYTKGLSTQDKASIWKTLMNDVAKANKTTSEILEKEVMRARLDPTYKARIQEAQRLNTDN